MVIKINMEYVVDYNVLVKALVIDKCVVGEPDA